MPCLAKRPRHPPLAAACDSPVTDGRRGRNPTGLLTARPVATSAGTVGTACRSARAVFFPKLLRCRPVVPVCALSGPQEVRTRLRPKPVPTSASRLLHADRWGPPSRSLRSWTCEEQAGQGLGRPSRDRQILSPLSDTGLFWSWELPALARSCFNTAPPTFLLISPGHGCSIVLFVGRRRAASPGCFLTPSVAGWCEATLGRGAGRASRPHDRDVARPGTHVAATTATGEVGSG